MSLMGVARSMTSILADQYTTHVAPVTPSERAANLQINVERAHFAKAAKDVVETSVYNQSGIVAPTVDAKVGHNINISA